MSQANRVRVRKKRQRVCCKAKMDNAKWSLAGRSTGGPSQRHECLVWAATLTRRYDCNMRHPAYRKLYVLMVSATDWRPPWPLMVLPPQGELPRWDPPLGTPSQFRIPSPTSSVPMLDAESLQSNIDSSASQNDLPLTACKQVVTAAQLTAHARGGLGVTQSI